MRCKGFTLLEATLALSVGALILVSLTNVFQSTRAGWKVANYKSDMTQHARVAVSRMTSELRYATRLTLDGGNLVEFETNNLLDSDKMTTETIRYSLNPPYIERSVNGGAINFVAGGVNTSVSDLLFQPLKIDAGGDLVPLVAGDPVSLAVAVQIHLTLSDPDSNRFEVVSLARMRNL